MQIDLQPAWAASVYFLSLRIGALLIMTPILAALSGLVTVRALLSIMLAVVFSSAGAALPPAPTSLGMLVAGSLIEVAIGLTLAFGVFAAFGAFSVAGKILDVQSGFGIGSVFDPVTRAGAPLFSTMLTMLAVVVFFGMDGHHALLRAIAFSVQQLPPGAPLAQLRGEAVIGQFGLMFSLGVALIAPVMFGLFLIEAALAVVSRVLPQMNVFVVGVPLKIVAALALFALTIGVFGHSMGRVYASLFRYWQQVLA
jgi:flagellar biosynthesis protein FliR